MSNSRPLAPLRIESEQRIPLQREDEIGRVAQVAAQFANDIGLGRTAIQMLITAIYELGTNTLTYAGHGEFHVQRVRRQQQRGVRIIAEDQGPGIEDIAQAMVDGFTTQPQFRSLGLGLGGVFRLMDEMSIESQPGVGTRVTACKWADSTTAGHQASVVLL